MTRATGTARPLPADAADPRVSRIACRASSCEARCTGRRTSTRARRRSRSGSRRVLADGDRVACTYRGHGHLLAMGTEPEALLAELLGRETGVNGGRAGSMNVVDPDHGVLGCYGIVGGSIATATGRRALAARLGRGRGRLLRRRHREPGLLLRVPELREGDVAAGRLRLREQRLRRVHAVRGGDAGRDRRTCGGVRVPTTRGRRDGRRRGARRGRRGRRRGCGRAAARSSSRHGPTASSATRAATRAPTGPRASSSAGASATRSRSRGDARWPSTAIAAAVEGRGRRHCRARPDRGGGARGAVPERALDLRVLRAPAFDGAVSIVDIGMPRLSDSMEEATVLAWLKRPGDEAVRRGEPLVEIETDKATAVYEAEADGVLDEIVADEGEHGRLGAPIARLRVAASAEPHAAPVPARPVRAAAAGRILPPASAGRSRATPVARRLAGELGIAARPGQRDRAGRPDRAGGSRDGRDRHPAERGGAGRPWRGRRTPPDGDAADDRLAHVRVPLDDPGLHARG